MIAASHQLAGAMTILVRLGMASAQAGGGGAVSESLGGAELVTIGEASIDSGVEAAEHRLGVGNRPQSPAMQRQQARPRRDDSHRKLLEPAPDRAPTTGTG